MSDNYISAIVCKMRDGVNGYVSLRIRRNDDVSYASLGIVGELGRVLTDNYPTVIRGITIIYCIIEKLIKSGNEFTASDITHRFTELGGINTDVFDRRMPSAGGKFVMNANVATIRKQYRDSFVIVHDSQATSDKLIDFIEKRADEMRNAGRTALCRSYITLRMR